MKNSNYLTVEQLADIVDSQIILFGNRPTFVKLSNQIQEIDDLFFLHVDGEIVIESCEYSETDKEEYGLEVIAKRLKNLPDDAFIEYSHSTPIATGFALGFKAESRFVEVINSNELQPQVVVVE